MDERLNSPEVRKLGILIEEATRANSLSGSSRYFIEPATGTLDRAKSKRHHIIFGRRGSGKTSLLLKAKADLSLDRCPTAFVDLEGFKRHAYPDVVLSVLIEALSDFDKWLENEAQAPGNKTSFWVKIFGRKPSRPPLDRKAIASTREEVKKQLLELRNELHSPDGAAQKATVSSLEATTDSTHSEIAVKAGPVSVDDGEAQKNEISRSQELVEQSVHSKVEFLRRHILDYERLFSQIANLSSGNAYLFLDDLYHIPRKDQSELLDYFHRVAKGRGLWLKIGTIRHRTTWYRHGDPSIGMKLGDDCDSIDLDITLEKFGLAKDFLKKVLEQLLQQADLSKLGDLLTPGGMDRLVLASGGVARDFLTITRRSIDTARERLLRGGTYRGPRVGAEDVNVAASEHDESKRDELARDSKEERRELEAAFESVLEFCFDKKVNCILVEMGVDTRGANIIAGLVDLRLLHKVASRVTISGKAATLYSAFMLDVSQYTGNRKRRDFEEIELGKIDRLRRVGLVFDPDQRLYPQDDQARISSHPHLSHLPPSHV